MYRGSTATFMAGKLVSEQKKVIACYAWKRRKSVPHGCDHEGAYRCKDCLSTYFRERLDDIENFPVKCMNHTSGCDNTLLPDIALELWGRSDEQRKFLGIGHACAHAMHALLRDSWANLLPPQISPLFTACVTQKFHLTKTLGYIAFCPLCNEIMGAETPAELHGHEVRCNGCGELVCIDCGCKWHAGQTCAQYKGSQVDGATQALLNECMLSELYEGTHHRGHACHHIAGWWCLSCGHHFCYVAWDPTTNVAAHGRAALSAGGRWVETHRGARTVAAPFVQTAGRGIRARTAMATTIAWLAFPSLRLSWLKTNGWVLARCSDPVQTPVSYSYKL